MIILDRAELVDAATSWPVESRSVTADGFVTSYVEEEVLSPSGQLLSRQYVRHPGAVGVIALDDDDRVALVRQYRHPVRHRLIEPPAGLLDVEGEDYRIGAERELAEEVGLGAASWRVLVDLFTSPGMASESLRVYLARDLTPADAPEGFEKHGEEAHMDIVWARLADLVEAVLAGDLHNPVLVSGVLATAAARTRGGFDTLRPADAPWPARDTLPTRH